MRTQKADRHINMHYDFLLTSEKYLLLVKRHADYNVHLSSIIKSLFNNKCYCQGGHSSSRFLFVMWELWDSITTEEQA